MLTKEVRYIFSQFSRDGHYIELEFTPREVSVLKILGHLVANDPSCPGTKVNAIKIARLVVGSLDSSNVHGTLLNVKHVIEWFAENHSDVDTRENGDNVPQNLGDLLKKHLQG